ncbi:hypothetical protein MMC28_001466 [Mycoblastus sanguinarius]|nr:hypothetical protein [Mycoblastus sanguinarius]
MAKHVNHFTYYWLALDSLPNLLDCMGFVLDSTSEVGAQPIKVQACDEAACSQLRHCKHKTQLIINTLSLDKAWLIDKAMGKLKREWLTREGNKDGPKQFKSMLTIRCSGRIWSDDEKSLIRESQRQWKTWRDPPHNSTAAQSHREQARTTKVTEGSDSSDYESPGEFSSSDEEVDSEIGEGQESESVGLPSPGAETTNQELGNHSSRYSPEPRSKARGRAAITPKSWCDETNTPNSAPQVRRKLYASHSNVNDSKHRSLSVPHSQKSAQGHSLSEGSPVVRTTQDFRPQRPNTSIEEGRTIADSPVAIGRNRRRKSGETVSHNNQVTIDGAQSKDSSPLDRPPPYVLPSPPNSSPCPQREPRTGHRNSSQSTSSLISSTDTSEYCDGRPSITPATSSEDALGSLNPERRAEPIGDIIPFVPYFKESKPTTLVTHATLRLMKQRITAKKDLSDGYIYILRIRGQPGFVKIGRTENPIETRGTDNQIEIRRKQINKCVPAELEAFNKADFCEVPNHGRVETLIHTELQNLRSCFRCACRQKATHEQEWEGNDGLTVHGEWFRMDEARAVEVVARWRKWMNSDPYCGGQIRRNELLRINYYDRDPDRMEALTIGDSWRWQEFMNFPQWKLWYFCIRNELYAPRPEMHAGTRWDSLWIYWQPNVLVYLTFYFFSLILFTLSEMFSSRFGLIPLLSFVNSAVLGTCAVMYSA